ncbi:MAG: hypothetical protein LBM92_03430, partial [Opitutaceae bacterium]|nr:hypothetical protein [Opitutaceae bacterium]
MNTSQSSDSWGNRMMRRFLGSHWPWCLAYGVLVLFVFSRYLVTGEHVLSQAGTDAFSYYIYSYKLGLEGLRGADLVFWNPYNYGGQPFFGQMQSALFYPATWLVAPLPLADALNALVCGHQWLLALGMYGWCVSRGMRRPAAFFAGAIMMLGSQYMLHAYAGHVSNLCCMAWIPFIFWGINADRPRCDSKFLLDGLHREL